MPIFGTKKYPDDLNEMYEKFPEIYQVLYAFLKKGFVTESLDFLEAVRKGVSPQTIYRQWIEDDGDPFSSTNPVNLSSKTRKALMAAATSQDGFDHTAFAAALPEAVKEARNLVEQEKLYDFWESDEFWQWHLEHGGDKEDLREVYGEVQKFINLYDETKGWTAPLINIARTIITSNNLDIKPPQLVELLERQGWIKRKPLFNWNSLAAQLKADPRPIQAFFMAYAKETAKKEPNWDRARKAAQTCLNALGRTESSEDFLKWLAGQGFISNVFPEQLRITRPLSLPEFIERLPAAGDDEIDTRLADVVAALVLNDETTARGMVRDLTAELVAGVNLAEMETFEPGLLNDYLFHLAETRRDMPSDDDASNLENERFANHRENLNELLQTPEDVQRMLEALRQQDRLSLDDFVQRLPGRAEGLIEAFIGDIRWAMEQDEAALVQSNVADLINQLVGVSDPEDGRRVDRGELRDYILTIARNGVRRNGGGNGPGGGNGRGGGDDNSSDNAHGGGSPRGPVLFGVTSLTQMMRSASHLEGAEARKLMEPVHAALSAQDAGSAKKHAFALARALLGPEPADPGQRDVYKRELDRIAQIIVAEIGKVVKAKRPRPDNDAGERPGPRRDPEGGAPGAAAVGKRRQRKGAGEGAAAHDRELAKRFALDIKEITRLILAEDDDGAAKMAEDLAADLLLQPSSSNAPKPTASEILSLAFKNSRPQMKSGPRVGPEPVDPQYVKKVKWPNFYDVYQIDPGDKKKARQLTRDMMKAARKAVRDQDKARPLCNDILKDLGPDKPDTIRNGRHLALALVDAVSKKERRKKLTKPLKMKTEEADA